MMRIHCLGGVGSIGSLVSTHLAQLPSTKVRLILRRKDLAQALFSSKESNPSLGSYTPDPGALVSLQVERSGLVKRTDGLEVELTPSPEDRAMVGRTDFAATFFSSKLFPDLVRNDPIDTLIITTKATSTLRALKVLLPRLSSKSTIVILQNGMGVLEGMLDTYWPEDNSIPGNVGVAESGRVAGRPSFICATTTHGVWRKTSSHFVHAGVGDIKFGVVPNRAVQASLASMNPSPWGEHYHNPLLNPRSLTSPTLEHLPLNPDTISLHRTVSALLQLQELKPLWLPLPTFQITQLQKLAVNTAVNGVTAIMGVPNGALVGSPYSRELISSICRECSSVFAAHVAREEGNWTPPPLVASEELYPSFPRSSSPSPPTPHPPPPPLPASHPLSTDSLTDYTLRVLFKTSANFSSTLVDILNTHSQFDNESTSSFSHFNSMTEIDYMNGYVIALGKRYHISTPVVKAVREMVLLKEEMLKAGAVDLVLERRFETLSSTRPNRESVFDSPGPGGNTVDNRQTGNRAAKGVGTKAIESRAAERAKKAHQRSRDAFAGKLIKKSPSSSSSSSSSGRGEGG